MCMRTRPGSSCIYSEKPKQTKKQSQGTNLPFSLPTYLPQNPTKELLTDLSVAFVWAGPCMLLKDQLSHIKICKSLFE